MITSKQRASIYILFFFSGFSALIYEVLWARMLTLTFGSTIYAVSVVTAVFMGGLALGSYLFGFVVDRCNNLLRIYAALEVGIALFAALFPPTLNLATDLHIWFEHLFPGIYQADTLIHLVIASVLLLPPTILMGGTFPTMCRLFVQKQRRGEIGRLYAVNTLGATLGALGCGFILLPLLGHTLTNFFAILINLAIATTTYQLGASIDSIRPQSEMPKKMWKGWRIQHLRIRHFLLVLIATAVIGGVSLAYEILWTRLFLLFLGNTSFAFAIILGVYLLSLATGGAIAARLVERACNIWCLFTLLVTLMGLVVAATVPFYDQLAHLFLALHDLIESNWAHLNLGSLGIVFLVIGLPTMISGALFPIAVALLTTDTGHTGEKVGLVVLFNTIGAVVGSLLAGFVLIPLFGTQNAFTVLAGVNIALGIALFIINFAATEHRILVPSAAVVGIASILLASPWDARLMNSGVYIYAQNYLRQGGLDPDRAGETLLDVVEGSETTVAVYENDQSKIRYFTVNGKTDGGTGRDMITQLLVSHLPMLLHPDPEEAMVIGLGTGISLAGLSSYPVRSIDCVEISPEVVKASEYFSGHNGKALSDPKINLMVEDGRNLLKMMDKEYDVIISEPSNPWQAGNSNLFTREFFEIAASRLKPGGIFTQWVGMYDITPENLRVVVRTLMEEFPNVLAFRTGTDLILVASKQPLGLNYQQIAQRLNHPVIRKTLELAEIQTPGDMLANYYLFNENALKPFAAEAYINTDDHPLLEYSAHLLLKEPTPGAYQMQNMQALLEHATRPTLPLQQLGANNQQIQLALQQLASDYAKHGRENISRQFADLASKL